MNKYLDKQKITLLLGDCLNYFDNFPADHFDMIFADPPYKLSNDGITCKAGEMVSVNKADWDKSEGFSKDMDFHEAWIKSCKRVLKPSGTIWISGTNHNIFKNGYLLQKLGFKILNDISWFKPNAPPNLSCRYFTHSHETLLWAIKSEDEKHTFNYEEMKKIDDEFGPRNKQMRSVWKIPLTPPSEKKQGKHPTQKPLELLKRIVIASTNEGDKVLDPFNGSGTTGLASVVNNREYVGIDTEEEYLDLTIKRLKNLEDKKDDVKVTDFV